MIPSFQLFGRTITIYTVFVLVGVLGTLFATYRLAKKNALDEIETLYMTLIAFAAAAIGGTLLYGLTNIQLLITLLRNLNKVESFGQLIQYLGAIFGGSVFYGGLIGMLLTALLYVHKKRLSARYLDAAACAIPLFHAIGRIGCFLGGCCFGVESEFGFVYHHSPVAEANGVRRLPVQLFEAAFNFLLCWMLYRLFRKKKWAGWLLHLYLLAYPVFRFVIEFFRGDAYRGFLWGLSTSQWISLLLLVVNGAVFALRVRKQKAVA